MIRNALMTEVWLVVSTVKKHCRWVGPNPLNKALRLMSSSLLRCVPEMPLIRRRFFICCCSWTSCKHQHKSSASLLRQKQFPPCCFIYHRTFLHQKPTTHTLTYTNPHARYPSCQCKHKHTGPVEAVFTVQCPLPLVFPSLARRFA